METLLSRERVSPFGSSQGGLNKATPFSRSRKRFILISLAQLHDAASYYYDHQDEIEAQLQANSPSEEKLEERRKQWERLTQKGATRQTPPR